MNATELETAVTTLIAEAKTLLAGEGHVSTAPDITLAGGGKKMVISDERYVHPTTAARLAIKDGWSALLDKIPAPRNWDHIDGQMDRLFAAAEEMNLGIDAL